MTERRPPTADGKDPLLSLIGHEFRGPLTPLSGYLRMVLTDQAGALSEKHRRYIEEAQKSIGRLSALLEELSDLSTLEGGGARFQRAPVDLGTVIQQQVEALPPMTDRDVRVIFRNESPGATVEGDPARLRKAVGTLIFAMRREQVASDELGVSLRRATLDGQAVLRTTIAGSERLAQLEEAGPADLKGFLEYRGGVGLGLAVARLVVDAHRGRLYSPIDNEKAGAVLVLPQP